MTPLDPEERIFSLSDLVRLFRRRQKMLLRIGLYSGLLGVLFVLYRPVQYKIEATFKESAERNESENALKEFLGMASSLQAPQAAALMQSQQVLKPLICRIGLQASVADRGWISRQLHKIEDLILAEMGRPLSDIDTFRFSDVSYEGERPTSFQLRFVDFQNFQLIQGRKIVLGRINESVQLDDASFCLTHAPKHMKIGRIYSMQIISWVDAVRSVQNHLKIVSHKLNHSIYDLSIQDRDRFLGEAMINTLMSEYQNYLKRSHDQVAEAQIAYLQERQEDLFKKLGSDFDEHVSYLHNSVGSKGFVTAEQETEAFMTPYIDLFSKSFSSEIESDQLSASEQGPQVFGWDSSPVGASIHRLRQEIQDLESQRDLMASSLFFSDRSQEMPNNQSQELQLVRQDLFAVKNALEKTKQNDLPLQLKLYYDPDQFVQSWASQIQEQGKGTKDLALYLDHLVRLFSVREKILVERQIQPESMSSELEGIDLDTDKQLIIETSHKLDEAKANIEHYRRLFDRMDDFSFELSSLSAVLHDPASQDVLRDAIRIDQDLKDEGNFSEKETERSKREAALQRKILKEHLRQMIAVEELNQALHRDKIKSLQQIGLDCIHRQICVREEQIASLISNRKSSLVREKELLEKKMQDLRSKMSDLPERWRAESLLKLKTELGIKIMQSVAQLVESKTISQNLHHVESKPLDIAKAPLLPKRPHLFLFFLIGSVIGSLGGFIVLFLRTLYRGFPTSPDALSALRYPFSGMISFQADGPHIEHLPDHDLESLRKIILKIDTMPSKVIGLITGSGPDYSHSLARLLSQCKKTALLIRCDFGAQFSEKDRPGLLQMLSGALVDSPIQSLDGYDMLPSGGYSRFGAELIQSKGFSDLLQSLSSSYDHILLIGKAPLSSAESESLLRICHSAVVTIGEEPIELLTPFIRWAYDKERCRLTFLVASYSS